MVGPVSATHGPDWQERSVAPGDLPHRRRLVGERGQSAARPVAGGSGVFQPMTENNNNLPKQIFEKLIDMIKRLPWMDILIDVGKFGLEFVKGTASGGIFEVLEYESTLEFHDPKGKRATFHKRQKVRYLQDNIIAYQDQAWGDGEILLRYRCAPGKPVDRYRLGHKTHILISLREVKNKEDIDEFNIRWGIRDGFLRDDEQWETEISHPTDHLRVSLIFPKDRPPNRVVMIEGDRQRSQVLGGNTLRTLPNGRWQVVWETKNPRLHERYILKWRW